MNQYPPTSIAIVGMAAQFSGARNVSEFWDVVRNRQVTIRHFSRNDAIQSGLTADEAQSPDRVLAGGVLDEVTNFDAKLFQRTRRELEFADPQQRLLIQCAWTALEDAGCPPRQTKEKVGAFVGGTRSTYRLHQLRNYAPLRGTVEDYELNLGNDNDYLATRLAYHLSLDGPVMNIQTACSTSLAAVHAAAQSLLLEECDVALAGAVSISFPQRVGYIHSPGGILSPSGTCRPFSSQADGTVPGDGVGLVVLKRLEDAIRDGNQIWAVLCGSAVGNDGSQRASFTAPNPQGQARVIVEALSFAQFDPETIGYVEAHGTGTRVGDDIELRALHQVFVPGRVRPHNCVLGTAKACIGHCDAAAGIAGLIKVAMALRHRILPGMPHTEPCSAIAASNSPFVINSDSVTWSASETPRRAAVSSFGLGGTNVHLVAQEYVAQKSKLVRGNGPWLLPVSAETPNALKSAIGNLERHLTTCEYELADVARTLQQGRTILSLRRAFLVHDSETRSLFSGDEFEGPNDVTAGHDAWLFPGQGVDLEGAAGAWWNQFPRFRAILSEHARIVSDRVNVDVLPLLVTGDKQASGELRQLGLVVLEVSIARFLFALGIRPTRLVGHSLGEFSAACVAQIMTFEDMIQVVATRAKLIEDLPIGTMVAVACDEERCRGIVGDDVDIACVNAPAQVVLSADAKSMEVAVNRLRDQGIHTQELPVTHAFHSRHVIPAAASLRQILATVPLRSPIMELISSVTGQRLTDEQARSPDYWAEHLHRPVRFVEVSITLCDEGLRDAIEIGPGRTLIRLIQSLAKRDNRSFHPTLIQNDPTSLSLWTLVARHWCHGVIIDWKQLTTGQSQLVSLPTYEFERETFIFDAPVHNELERSDTLKLNPPAPVSTSEIQRLIPGWQPVSEGTVAPTTTHLLVVAQDSIWAKDCVRRLSGQGRTVTRCAPNGIEILELAESTAFGAVVCLLEDCITELDESAVSLGWETCFSAYRFLREMILTIRRLPEPRPALVLAGRKLLPERIIPIAAFAGLARLALVARQEIPGLLVGCLDLGVEPHATDLYERLGHAIDLIASGHGHLLKLEEGQIHKPNYAAKVTNAPVKSQPLLDPDSAGHYVVFGGHTGVGKAWIQKLLDITPLSRISLICLPDDFVLAQQTASALGPRVIVWSLDEIQSDAVRLVLRSTERQLGKITGIFQAERLYGADDDVTITAPISAHRRHFACRIGILATLAEVVTEFSPEFVCALSSLSSVLGGIGRAPHAASSAAMDAFATSIPQRSCLWGTVNLDLWDVEIPSKANPMELESPHLMSLSEGQIGLLKAIVCLSQDRHSIVVKGNFQKRFQTWVQSRSVSKPDLAIGSIRRYRTRNGITLASGIGIETGSADNSVGRAGR